MESNKCDDCGTELEDMEIMTDDDGRFLCSDCLFERQCEKDND